MVHGACYFLRRRAHLHERIIAGELAALHAGWPRATV